MANNPLHPTSPPPTPDRILDKGHGTRALGPSDSSDSGSDVIGAGPNVGDANLDSDSDRFGTGESASALPDTAQADGADIAPDHIEVVDGKTGESRRKR
jgi:hypothetical protein